MNPDDERYFEVLEGQLDEAISVARDARERGGDPTAEVEIPVAKDMADRVENILGIDGVAQRVRELEGEMSREEAALELARDFAEGGVGDFESRAGKVEAAVRTAVALLTEGVVAAPIEGIDRVEVMANDDGSEFVRVFYAGPIRSAGGTAQALSVLVADYVRTLLGFAAYQPRRGEVKRYAEELTLYDKETGLQYTPADEETEFIARNCPVMLDGEATGDEEVSGYRDLDRVGTNTARGGMCLVLGEGIAQKAPKIKRYTDALEEVNWPWLEDLIEGTVGAENDAEAADTDGDEGSIEGVPPGGEPTREQTAGEAESAGSAGPPRPDPTGKYLRDLIAGRPVFGHPSEAGGFRLRYGRARNHGFATAGVHPATMHLVDDFLATGTQLKTERPGKAAGVVPVDSIEGPTVRLANGDVRRIDDPGKALAVRNGVDEILDLGEYLVNYGEFLENNHQLVPASYTVEWWVQDLAAAGADVQALRDAPSVDLQDPGSARAIDWASTYDAPLHPTYTYLWHDISVDAFERLAEAVAGGTWVEDPGGAADRTPNEAPGLLELPNDERLSTILEALLVEHTREDGTLTIPDALPLVRSLGLTPELTRTWDDLPPEVREWEDGKNAVEAVNAVAPFVVRERAPTRVGSRMGRPEKSEKREMNPAVHTLFPIGEAGGDQRDVTAAAAHTETMQDTPGEVTVEVGRRACKDCDEATFRPRCPDCGAVTEPKYTCPDCNREVLPDESGRTVCPRCDVTASPVEPRTLDVHGEYRQALERVGVRENAFDILKGVKGLTSELKVPEPLEKGVLRAKNGVSAFKDGTVRYDMTDLPVTSVRPAELDVDADRLRELGYQVDVDGEPLRRNDQLIELKVQDIVLSDGAAEHMLRTADFVDDLLVRYYGLEPFYDLDDRDDLVGELVFGMAPHTSAAVVGRIVGFTSAAVGYAHPYFHAAKRRNCFHPETRIRYEDETGTWQQDSIRDFVEERLVDPREDDVGTLVTELDGENRVQSIDEAGNTVLQSVEAVSKHPASDHLVRIVTRGGRTVTVTPDHEMLRWQEGIERIAAPHLNPGDLLPVQSSTSKQDGRRAIADGGETALDCAMVDRVEYVEAEVDHTYCVTVATTHTLFANGIGAAQCDGDEDCVMLLMDGLLNFSKSYLPDRRGGRMDSPLVMSSRIDPTEIDDEAHNVDVVESYSREFYEATRRMADPGTVDVATAETSLGTDDLYRGFRHTHDTSNIAAGPDLSAYKTLADMEAKMDAQLELARKLRAVDEADVAERIIEYHFLPDLLGNLRAFSRQDTRCRDCGIKFRRPPLSGDCRVCGGEVSLTVYEGSVTKYMDTAMQVATEYGASEYTKQRLNILERSIESIFEDDHNKQSGIADFM